MQRNGGAASVAGVHPLLLAKCPVESLSPPSNNQSVSQTFAPVFHKLRIWGKSFKEKMLLYFRDVKSKIECSHSALCFWPSQAGNPPSVRHSQWALKPMLPTRWTGTRCPQKLPRALLAWTTSSPPCCSPWPLHQPLPWVVGWEWDPTAVPSEWLMNIEYHSTSGQCKRQWAEEKRHKFCVGFYFFSWTL